MNVSSILRRPARDALVLLSLLGLVLAGALVAVWSGGFVLAVLGLVLAAVFVADLRAAFVIVLLYLLAQPAMMGAFEEGSRTYRLLNYLDDALLLGLAGVAAVRGTARRLPAAMWWAVGLGALAVVVGGVSVLQNGRVRTPALLDGFALSKWFLVLFAATRLPLDGPGFERVTRWVTGGALVLAGFGAADLVAPSLTRGLVDVSGPLAYRGGMRCLVSIFANEGVAGWAFAAAACVPLAGYLALRRRPDLVAAVVLAGASVLSLRRKPVVGLVAALLAWVVLRGGIRDLVRVTAAVLLVALLLLPLVGDVLGDSFEQAWEGHVASPDPTVNARNALYLGGWRIAVDHFPLGAGLGMFGGAASVLEYSEFYARYGLSRVWGLGPAYTRFVADAFYAHLLGALGFVGAGLFLGGLLVPLAAVARRMRAPAAPHATIAATAAFLIGVEGIVEAVAAPVYEASLSAFLVAAATGLALSAHEASRRPEP